MTGPATSVRFDGIDALLADARSRLERIDVESAYREALGGAARFWLERAYGEAIVRTASPARMRHLEQIMANDGHLPELARKARETMAEPARG